MRRTSLIFVLAVVLSAAGGYLLGASNGDSPVWQADEAFNRALAERNRKAFSSWIHEEAIFMGDGTHTGREAIVEAWSVYFDRESGHSLGWQPHTAFVSPCGDMGYTIGDYETTARLEGGELQHLGGEYVTLWQKGRDGAWRVRVDIGTPPEALGEEIPAEPLGSGF